MLGFIPDWQFSGDPRVNPNVNPHVSMPAGIFQAGAYSTQPPYGPLSYGPLGEFRCLGCQPPVAGPQLGYVMIDETPVAMPDDTLMGVFDSFWWQHRKAFVVTGLGLVGMGLLAVAALVK